MAPPEKGPRGSPGVAGHADLQPVFHWISRGVEISKLLPYLIHPSWFLNTPFSAHHQLYFSVTSSISFSTSLSSPSPPSSVTSSSPFLLQACSLVPTAAATPPGSVPSCLTFSPVPWVLESVLTHDSATACVGGSKPVSLVQACLWDPSAHTPQNARVLWVSQGLSLTPCPSPSPPANPPRKSPPPVGPPLHHPVPPWPTHTSWSLPRDWPMPCSPGTTLEHLVGPAMDEALGNAEPSTSTLTADSGGPWPRCGSDLTKFARVRPRLTPPPDLDPCPLRVWLIVFSSGSERGHGCHMPCLIKDDRHTLVRLLHRNCISKAPSLLSTHLCV